MKIKWQRKYSIWENLPGINIVHWCLDFIRFLTSFVKMFYKLLLIFCKEFSGFRQRKRNIHQWKLRHGALVPELVSGIAWDPKYLPGVDLLCGTPAHSFRGRHPWSCLWTQDSLEGSYNTCCSMDESWGQNATWDKPITKRQILYDSTYQIWSSICWLLKTVFFLNFQILIKDAESGERLCPSDHSFLVAAAFHLAWARPQGRQVALQKPFFTREGPLPWGRLR